MHLSEEHKSQLLQKIIEANGFASVEDLIGAVLMDSVSPVICTSESVSLIAVRFGFESLRAHHASPLRATRGAARRRQLGRSSVRRSLSGTKAKTDRIIRRQAFPEQDRTGAAADLTPRMADGNAGKISGSARGMPVCEGD